MPDHIFNNPETPASEVLAWIRQSAEPEKSTVELMDEAENARIEPETITDEVSEANETNEINTIEEVIIEIQVDEEGNYIVEVPEFNQIDTLVMNNEPEATSDEAGAPLSNEQIQAILEGNPSTPEELELYFYTKLGSDLFLMEYFYKNLQTDQLLVEYFQGVEAFDLPEGYFTRTDEENRKLRAYFYQVLQVDPHFRDYFYRSEDTPVALEDREMKEGTTFFKRGRRGTSYRPAPKPVYRPRPRPVPRPVYRPKSSAPIRINRPHPIAKPKPKFVPKPAAKTTPKFIPKPTIKPAPKPTPRPVPRPSIASIPPKPVPPKPTVQPAPPKPVATQPKSVVTPKSTTTTITPEFLRKLFSQKIETPKPTQPVIPQPKPAVAQPSTTRPLPLELLKKLSPQKISTQPAFNRTPKLNDWTTSSSGPNVTSGSPTDLFNPKPLVEPTHFRPDVIVKLALEILPVADGIRVYTGKDPFTGEEVNRWEATGSLALNFAPWGLGKAGKLFDGLNDLRKSGVLAKTVDITGDTTRATNAVDKLNDSRKVANVADKATDTGKGTVKSADKVDDIYTTPVGGGGVTNIVEINGKQITIGHGGRHLKGTNLSVDKVNSTIANEISKIPPGAGKAYKGQIYVDGILIEYRAFGVTDDIINVGTYYPK